MNNKVKTKLSPNAQRELIESLFIKFNKKVGKDTVRIVLQDGGLL